MQYYSDPELRPGKGASHPVPVFLRQWTALSLDCGSLKVGREDDDVAAPDPAQLGNRDVQVLCRVSGDACGMGVFEQLALGPYAPPGLEGY